MSYSLFTFFFFYRSATTDIYTLSLTTLFRSDLSQCRSYRRDVVLRQIARIGARISDHFEALVELLGNLQGALRAEDRKSTRLNSSHSSISYAVFCLKKKKMDH